MSEKTNAMRLLDSKRIPYQPFYYSSDIHSAEDVAAAVGVPASIVYKTLVVMRATKGRPMLIVVPGDRELDLKLAAKAVGEKSIAMALQRDAERLTGLQVGGISPLALLSKGFDIFLDQSALSHEEIIISAGKRGINLRLRVSDLLAVTGARPIEATRSPSFP